VSDVRLPPNDNDAEEAVIGSLLIDGSAIFQIADFLQPVDFYFEQNQWLYEAAVTLYKRDEAINQVTLAQELSRKGRLEPCGGVARLSYLISVCPTSLDRTLRPDCLPAFNHASDDKRRRPHFFYWL
jgi:replicative DNA helicase